jgi:hypothetical protein
MKVSPRADYPVDVRLMYWEVPTNVADLYEGIYLVTLNNIVDIQFCPAVSAVDPLIHKDLLPWNLDEITTTTQARLATVLLSRYTITPNDVFRGQQVQLVRDDESHVGGGLVYYIAESEFEIYSSELRELNSRRGGRSSQVTVSSLGNYAVVRFLRDIVVPSPKFRPSDKAWLQDASD